MNIIYMGTPDFAVKPLQCLIDGGHNVIGVITQPDKPKGRGGRMNMSPVKEKALEYGIEVFQPLKVRMHENVEWIKEKRPDVIIVAAFGQILSKEILELPKYGCVNIHASLLPKLRGAAPIQQAVIDGDKEAGVTIMQMDEGIDTGDILMCRKIELDEKETGGSLFDKLADIGGPLLLETLELIENNTIARTPQSGESTYAKMLDKKMGLIDFNNAAIVIERLIRGLNPWPSAYSHFNGKMIKIWDADVIDLDEEYNGMECGQVVKTDKEAIYVKTGDGILRINELQPEGKKRMDTGSYLRGCSIKPGDLFEYEN